jgi:hypothetical protein
MAWHVLFLLTLSWTYIILLWFSSSQKRAVWRAGAPLMICSVTFTAWWVLSTVSGGQTEILSLGCPFSPQSPTDCMSANPQSLGLILLSQIRKFLRNASCQSATCKPAIFFVVQSENRKFANFFAVPIRLLQIRSFFTIGHRWRNLTLKSSLSFRPLHGKAT